MRKIYVLLLLLILSYGNLQAQEPVKPKAEQDQSKATKETHKQTPCDKLQVKKQVHGKKKTHHRRHHKKVGKQIKKHTPRAHTQKRVVKKKPVPKKLVNKRHKPVRKHSHKPVAKKAVVKKPAAKPAAKPATTTIPNSNSVVTPLSSPKPTPVSTVVPSPTVIPTPAATFTPTPSPTLAKAVASPSPSVDPAGGSTNTDPPSDDSWHLPRSLWDLVPKSYMGVLMWLAVGALFIGTWKFLPGIWDKRGLSKKPIAANTFNPRDFPSDDRDNEFSTMYVDRDPTERRDDEL